MILFISANSSDSDIVRAVVNQLLQQRILFKGYFEQDIPHSIPDDFETYPAIICGNRLLATATPEQKARLEAYAKEKTLFVLDDSKWPNENKSIWCQDSLVEICIQAEMNSFAASAGIGNEVIPPLPQRTIIESMISRIYDFFEGQKNPTEVDEYHTIMVTSALAIEATPYATPELTEKINDYLKAIFNCNLGADNADTVTILGMAPIYAQRLHVEGYREKFEEVLNAVIDGRCRTPEGLLANSGRKDDPLALRAISDPSHITYFETNVMHRLSLNDMFVTYKVMAVGTAYTGNPKFFEEAWKIFTYIRKIHQDKDGLFFYASLGGKVIAEKWARGQAHALVGMFHFLTAYPDMPQDQKEQIIECIDQIGHGLIKVQRNDGRWSNILDRDYVRTDTSAAVLFTYVFASACNRGWLKADDYKSMIERARDALLTRFWRGMGEGNCRGMFPAFHNPTYYETRDQHMFIMPYIAPALIESAKMLGLPFD